MRTERRNLQKSRSLRREQTDAERLLWTVLRRKASGFKFRRQHQIGPWIADLCCPSQRLIIECDGGGHADPETERRDAERTAWLTKHGWRVLRFWNVEVFSETEAVVEVILTALHESAPLPDPLPASQGEGVR